MKKVKMKRELATESVRVRRTTANKLRQMALDNDRTISGQIDHIVKEFEAR